MGFFSQETNTSNSSNLADWGIGLTTLIVAAINLTFKINLVVYPIVIVVLLFVFRSRSELSVSPKPKFFLAFMITVSTLGLMCFVLFDGFENMSKFISFYEPLLIGTIAVILIQVMGLIKLQKRFFGYSFLVFVPFLIETGFDCRSSVFLIFCGLLIMSRAYSIK